MNKFKKGIKGQMYIPLNDKSWKHLNDNIEVFKAVCDSDFEYCKFETYDAEYQGDLVIVFEFDIRDRTFKECSASFSRFKKEIKNHFWFTPKILFTGKYEKI